jgi:hypothetical protein
MSDSKRIEAGLVQAPLDGSALRQQPRHSDIDSPAIPDDSPPSYTNVQPLSRAVSGVATQQLLRPVTMPPPGAGLTYYAIAQSTLSTDKTTVTTSLPAYATDPIALIALLKEQLALAPAATVRIRGTHSESSYSPAVVDFDTQLSAMPLLYRPAADRWEYLKVPSLGTKTGSGTEAAEDQRLERWAERYCASPATNKS